MEVLPNNKVNIRILVTFSINLHHKELTEQKVIRSTNKLKQILEYH